MKRGRLCLGLVEVVRCSLRPKAAGWRFTLDEEGTYPFVTHAFGDMVKGSLGVLKTPNAPEAGGGH